MAVIAAGVLGVGGGAVSAWAQDPATADAFHEIETKYIFGFTEGSGIGLEGEKEISIDTISRMGKRDGSYFASETRFEFEFTPSQYIQIELGPLAAANYIRNVTDLDNRNTFQPSGFFGEVRYLLLDRPASPLAVTLSFEPNYRAFDETSGARVQNYEFETKINADLEIVKNRLYAGFNLIYEPETTRFQGAWAKETTFGATGALAFRVTPALTVGGEVDYYRHYDGFFFNSFTGDAIFVGPTLHYQISPKMFMTAAWNAQVWGRETDTGNSLNLEEFSRYRAQVKLAMEF